MSKYIRHKDGSDWILEIADDGKTITRHSGEGAQPWTSVTSRGMIAVNLKDGTYVEVSEEEFLEQQTAWELPEDDMQVAPPNTAEFQQEYGDHW